MKTGTAIKPMPDSVRKNLEKAMRDTAAARGFWLETFDSAWSDLFVSLGSPEVESALRAAWEESGRPQVLKI